MKQNRYWVDGCIALLVAICVLLLQTPQHDREWQPFQSVLPNAEVTKDTVTLYDVRDWQHTATGTFDHTYLEEVVVTEGEVEWVWFTIQSFAAVEAVEHTMLTFELTNGEAYTFSIEARREADEQYTSLKGFFKQYEVLYSWGTARDFLGVRLFFLGDDLYHYPLELTASEEWQLLRYVATATANVHDEPRFYNTATANCTNLIAKAIDKQAVATKLPYGLAWNLPGYSDVYLKKHGYIPLYKSSTRKTGRTRLF